MNDLLCYGTPIALLVCYLLLKNLFKETPQKQERSIDHRIYIEPLPRINKVALWQYGSKLGKRNMNARDLEIALMRARADHNTQMVAVIQEALTYIKKG